MANLYEINQAILACVDSETGEIIDPELLNNLLMEREAKIEGVVCWIKNLESDALAYKAEKEAFSKRENAAKTKAKSLRAWLTQVLEGQKFSTAKCSVSFRKSTSVEIEDGTELLPEYQTIKTSTEPNKTAIKEALKNGLLVPGCRIVENINPQIK